MLAQRDLATIRAALAFWRDEMSPHEIEAQASYFDDEESAPLTDEELERLREMLRTTSLRTARFEGPTTLRLLTAAEAASAGERLAVVLIPPSESTDS